jgi:hypothetical protein
MAEYRHPRALDDVAGNPPAQVHLSGGHVAVDGETFDHDDEAAVESLADRYGVDLSALRVGGDTCETVKSDGEVCGRERPCPYHDDGGD